VRSLFSWWRLAHFQVNSDEKGHFWVQSWLKFFYLYQGLCEYQKRDLSKIIFTLIPPKVTLKDPAIGPLSEFFNFFFSQVLFLDMSANEIVSIPCVWYTCYGCGLIRYIANPITFYSRKIFLFDKVGDFSLAQSKLY